MKEQKQSKVKGFALGMALVLAMGAAATSLAMGIKNNGWFAPDNQEEEELPNEENNSANSAMNEINYMSLRMSNEAVVAVSETGVKTVSKTLTATVMPLDAPDKSVDWSIEWLVSPTDGSDINEYLSVSPESDGSLTATITAYKGFENAVAVVTATTRVGKYSATCQIKYDGAPESLTFVYKGKEISNSGSLTLSAGTTNEISLNLKNILGAIGSKYGDYEIVKIQGQGRFTMTKEYILNGSVKSSEDIVFNLEEGSYSYTDEVSNESQTLTITSEQFLTATISDDVLTVKAIKSESSYSNGYPRTGYRFTYKGTYTDPRAGGVADNCMWYIVVKEKVSGEESLIHIDIESAVNSIVLSDSVITF